MAAGSAPVSSCARTGKTGPMRLIRLLVIAVAMISRRRRCRFRRSGEALLHGRRKVALELARQVGVLGNIGMDERPIQPDLAVAQGDGELGTRQSLAGLAALGDLFLGRQIFQRAVQVSGALERADHVGVLAQARLRLELAGADRLALKIVVAQDQARHFVRHLHQQPVAARARDFLGAHRAVQQDLQIDFDVRGVHAGGVVDEIRVEPAAAPRELDAPELRYAEVAALADDLAVQLAGVDAHGVVAAVADIAVALEGRLDIGADAAVPK